MRNFSSQPIGLPDEIRLLNMLCNIYKPYKCVIIRLFVVNLCFKTTTDWLWGSSEAETQMQGSGNIPDEIMKDPFRFEIELNWRKPLQIKNLLFIWSYLIHIKKVILIINNESNNIFVFIAQRFQLSRNLSLENIMWAYCHSHWFNVG